MPIAPRTSLSALGAAATLGLGGCSPGPRVAELAASWQALTAGSRTEAVAPRGEGPPASPSVVASPSASASTTAHVVADARRRSPRPRGDGVDLAAARPGQWPEPTADEMAELDAASDLGDADAGLVDSTRALAVTAQQAFVFAAPSRGSTKLGYLRLGTIVGRSADPVGFDGCAGGWYAIEPEGYLCVGQTASLDLDDPLVAAARTRPDREAPLPYRYGLAARPTPQFYVKIPTIAEQRAAEPDLDAHLAAADPGAWGALPIGETPELLREGRVSPTVRRLRYPSPTVSLGRAERKSGFALLEIFRAEGRTWALNAELEVMALDRLRPVEPSRFRGLALDDELTLPVAFVHGRGQWLYTGTPGSGLAPGRLLEFREAVPLTGRQVSSGGVRYLEARRGGWIKDERVIRVDGLRNRPQWATAGRTWIDVSILEQSLVAYEGTHPVYVTLVSTGVDGLGDPEETHSTVRGQFLIHTKHVSVTMDGDEVGDEFDLRDVPYVQYFTAGYALHAAYWHDAFGSPRSHGCINLSPIDAAWLFEWTDPPVPERWHGALSLREGTLVYIHP